MSIVHSRKIGRRARSIAVGAIVLAAILGGPGPGVRAQEVVLPRLLPAEALPSASCPQPLTLPNVPVREPRPAEGAAPDLKWQTAMDPLPPTAAFIEPLSGNDAVIPILVGQGRLLTLKADVANERGAGVVAVADPTVIDFDVMPNPRILRLVARRVGVTDLSITTADGQVYNFEVQVIYDLPLLTAQLRQLFPDAQLRLTQIREHLAVEGQARSVRQVDQILKTLEVYLASVQVPSNTESKESGKAGPPPESSRGRRRPAQAAPEEVTPGEPAADGTPAEAADAAGEPSSPDQAVPEPGGKPKVEGSIVAPQIINLLRVPGVHQVMLQVRMAEVNRTGLREIGADILGVNSATGNIMGTQIGGGTISAGALIGGVGAAGNSLAGLAGVASGSTSGNTTAFGIFPSGDFELLIHALRRNSLLSMLAEPNLVAMSGQHANFLAGGEIAVPVPQNSGGGTTITIEWKNFGVQLDFLPFVMEDESVRLTVTPEVSTLDPTLGTLLNGTLVPGLNMRRASTTVEMRQGQTLAIAGLLQVELNAQTDRIPGLGDLPYLGPLFSNTSHKRVEKELLVLVTPHLVAPMNPEDVPCLPTDGITDPNDLEFYLLNRIEGRTGREFSSARNWDDPWRLRQLIHLEQRCISGPVGLSPIE